MPKPKVCILRTAGTNCDIETAFAFNLAGGTAEMVHINQFINKMIDMSQYQILAIPGGFTYGDDIAAGKILANELRHRLTEHLKKFIQDGKLIIGICNGFQVLVKSGLLPGNNEQKQEASLILNDSDKFEARWVYLRTRGQESRAKNCVWVKEIPEIIYLPVAHGEGKFVVEACDVLERIKRNGQVVFCYSDKSGRKPLYPDNPNGSLENIAGICDDTGRILGLMPHPERHIQSWQSASCQKKRARKQSDGLFIFQNAINYAKKHL
ncbi:MAG: phosphoribosylformylglycinamidine synthase I [Candidatus Omnitrophota bacterium]|nr:phosphoribosylformylglycinamidine synthase I [Candidatus Omnitrophota bacterium]